MSTFKLEPFAGLIEVPKKLQVKCECGEHGSEWETDAHAEPTEEADYSMMDAIAEQEMRHGGMRMADPE